MRRALAFAFVILTACTSAAETDASGADAGPGGSDGDGSDVGDVGTWSADDFGALDWFWYGTGRSDRFAMDRDCGIRTTSTAYGAPNEERVGVVAEPECAAFKTLSVSRPVLSTLRDAADACSMDTDDYATTKVTLANGITFQRTTAGCSRFEPFTTLQAEMRRLGTTYGVVGADAAVDAPDAD